MSKQTWNITMLGNNYQVSYSWKTSFKANRSDMLELQNFIIYMLTLFYYINDKIDEFVHQRISKIHISIFQSSSDSLLQEFNNSNSIISLSNIILWQLYYLKFLNKESMQYISKYGI